ncbi:MAG: ribonucleoside-diphosphate reductase, adenosylcobalamin-dependent [Candidatus Riflebacteria bacterium HGW-Riflebacteria-2]|jgi:ribonucleoside-diphosphate reductase alpha chain|nr:MAG: ribonucleoside-diphosphate reductase, adenosylcobalamin-dependent [Candidatus Riflebacteria bacterium HGW-Riflebacteria-2]
MNPTTTISHRFSPNAQKVLARRYLTRGPDGKPTETIEELFRRVARAIAAAENNYPNSRYQAGELEDLFFKIMTDLDYLPNSPTLMNAGKELGQLSACFVLPVDDSMEGIFDAVKNAALIHKSGGGTGFSFSRLRPANDIVSSTSGVSSGPISFMKVFNTATETIKQGGTRRGANMGILRVDHPDILDFITCKEKNDELTNFNISIAITDKFMEALERDNEYDLINPRSGEAVRSLKASKVFNMIVERAWRNGEPGIVFIDRINRYQPTPQVGLIESTNPCGEQPLLPYESCNLGSINLARFVKEEDGKAEVDFDRLREVIALSVRFLDNVIDQNRYPIPEIDKMTRSNRKIGLGVMGWSDMLIKLGQAYDSEKALETADTVMGFIKREAWSASQELARERGPFPNFEKSIFAEKKMQPLRNATVTTIAPTGTISMICGCSSGVEPLFAIAFEKHVMDNEKLVEVHQDFVKIARERNFYSEPLMEKIAKQGSLKGISEVPDEVARVFVTSHMISPEWHIRMQAAFQKHTDNAVSKTVNFPFEATIRDVETVFRLAHTLGCKGVTVYRDGSRDEQVLNVGGGKKGTRQSENTRVTPRARPERTVGVTERVKIGCGNLYVTVNSDEKGICEVFTSLGRNGGCPSQSEAAARLVSMALRAGVDVQEIIDQLKGIRCMSTIKRGAMSGGIKVLSCPDAIGKVIEQYHLSSRDSFTQNKGSAKENTPADKKDLLLDNAEPGYSCPECNEPLEHEGGCVICKSCGYSKCG